jgi:small-conductance mechanosensitive channel
VRVAASPNLAGAVAAGPTLDSACRSASPGIACRLVWDLSHSAHAADFTSVYLAGPIRLALRIALVLVLAFLLRAAAQRLITRVTARAAASQHQTEHPHAVFGDRRSQRGTALASLLGNAASVAIFTIAGLIILGDIGLNLAPILASAGVLGIALGFGAQNLVQDFLAGIFILLEDQYGVGDVVDVFDVTGTVEAVSLRITRIRDVNGVVWHIRNGPIKFAGNETHGWARAVVDFPVPYGTSVPAARQTLERAAVAMSTEPRWRAAILERPEVWGVETVSPDTLLMRVTARTAPLARAEVTRELRERLKTALDAEEAIVSASGAIPRQPTAAESDTVEPATVEPATAEPATAEPAAGKPAAHGPAGADSGPAADPDPAGA